MPYPSKYNSSHHGSYVEDQPPAYEEPPAYGDPPGSCAASPPPSGDVDAAPPSYDEAASCSSAKSNAPAATPAATTATTTTTTRVITQQRPADEVHMLVTVFHFVSIVCAVLSVLLTPLIEIIPAIFCFIILVDIQHSRMENNVLNVVDFVVTTIAMLLWLAFILVCAVFTFGICLIFLFILLPYFVVMFATGAGFLGFAATSK
eukprot:TRINITY_DN1079_c0_g2_i1.p1 TRINITY_DN1079_c0_g2~~TRINITY_DN1079_c0_g2_i1.p1  ORF type:complete len:204 (+),score=71.57 TRINITY_DN1079_c0_g2_i1:343-954(+)